MPPELSNSAIALLCEIGEFSANEASAEQKTHLDELIGGGFVVPDTSAGAQRYRMTAKATKFLGERGAGLNEA